VEFDIKMRETADNLNHEVNLLKAKYRKYSNDMEVVGQACLKLQKVIISQEDILARIQISM
jgi:hypothetical protein